MFMLLTAIIGQVSNGRACAHDFTAKASSALLKCK